MKLIKTAFRSLLGGGLKTWLNVFVLSISFVLILVLQGFLRGWSFQAIDDIIKWEIAGGQYWNTKYDPYDFFSLDSSASPIPAVLQEKVDSQLLEPILITQATIYPDGRMMGVLLKGIRPGQSLLQIPTQKLAVNSEEIPVMIGAFMARQSNLKLNDVLTLRWRDANGTFEAAEIKIAGIFKTTVPNIDYGQIWIDYRRLENMLMKENCANIMVKSPQMQPLQVDGWNFQSVDDLSASTVLLVKTKSMGTSILYIIFLLLAMLAIFDTQTLAIFRRQREIGTMVAMGMTQKQVVGFFTLEGTFYAVLAIALGTVWGAPLFWYLSVEGISFGMDASDIGVPMSDTMYVSISPQLVIGTILFLVVITALVSYLPASKIAKMNPTDAIRGKVH